MTATLDKTGDSWFHDLVLETFGLTPFVNTFPDFMAGGAVMITALFIAAGMEVIAAQTKAKKLALATEFCSSLLSKLRPPIQVVNVTTLFSLSQ